MDLPLDIRDLFYDVTNFKLTGQHITQTLLDTAALLPIVGGIKYSDEAGAVLKSGVKHGDEVADIVKDGRVLLPNNSAQIKHIFGDRPGHLPDTPSNRKLLTDTANNPEYYCGTDKYGNKWHVKTDDNGKQVWTRSQNGKINEGGLNNIPRSWDKDTGLYHNPFKSFRKGSE